MAWTRGRQDSTVAARIRTSAGAEEEGEVNPCLRSALGQSSLVLRGVSCFTEEVQFSICEGKLYEATIQADGQFWVCQNGRTVWFLQEILNNMDANFTLKFGLFTRSAGLAHVATSAREDTFAL